MSSSITLWRVDGSSELSYFYAGSSTPNEEQRDVSTFLNWDRWVMLPKHVAFKGDNGRYIGVRTIRGSPYNQYSSNNVGDPTASYEIITTGDGVVRIMSTHVGKFLRATPGWIWADSNDSSTGNADTLFWPHKVDKNIFVFRSVGQNKIVKRLSVGAIVECMNANLSNIHPSAYLEVVELALSRSIYNVEFRLMDARIYNKSIETMTIGEATNESKEAKTVDVKLSYKETKSRTWNSSVSLKWGVKTTIQTDVPVIADHGKVEISNKFDGEYEWGKTEESTNVVETVYKVTVPPMTVTTVSLLATKASCDVPFSYAQDDNANNGQKVTNNMDDGIYTGMNYFNFKYETKEKPL